MNKNLNESVSDSKFKPLRGCFKTGLAESEKLLPSDAESGDLMKSVPGKKLASISNANLAIAIKPGKGAFDRPTLLPQVLSYAAPGDSVSRFVDFLRAHPVAKTYSGPQFLDR